MTVIRTSSPGREFYMHANSVLNDAFDRLQIGTEVRFAAEDGEKGPQASSVQLIATPGAPRATSNPPDLAEPPIGWDMRDDGLSDEDARRT